MDRIASFCIDHNKLEPGIYLSRVDGDIKTFDLRVVKPNNPPFMDNAAMHTIEHIFATVSRNSEHSDKVIYFGPMGCRTGFYFLVRNMKNNVAIELIKECVKAIIDWNEDIPGITAAECGNYLEHDLEGAKSLMQKYYNIITNWTFNDVYYPQ